MAARQTNVVSSSLALKVHSHNLHVLEDSDHSCTETDNVVHDKNGGYEHVAEYIPIAQPNAATLAKLDAVKPSESSGDRSCTHVLTYSF